jgi:hypothetical protein
METVRRIETALTELEQLVSLIAPIPVDFSKINSIGQSLEGIRNRTLDVRVVKENGGSAEGGSEHECISRM